MSRRVRQDHILRKQSEVSLHFRSSKVDLGGRVAWSDRARRWGVAVIAAALAGGALAACGSGGPSDTAGAGQAASADLGCVRTGGAVAVAVGNRANSPQPGMPAEVDALARGAAGAGKPVTVVRIDGRPAVVEDRVTFASQAQNDKKRANDLTAWVASLGTTLTQVRAAAPEVDQLTALDVAARAVDEGGTVVLLDSGLQTTAPLDFRANGMLDAQPADVVAFLTKAGALPDLHGKQVVLIGTGDTAAPQQQLDAAARRRLVDLWSAIATASGASCVQAVTRTVSGDALDGVPPVSVVPVAAPAAFEPCGQTVLGDGGTVGFTPDTANLRDPAAARKTLADLAAILTGGRQRVELIGTTAGAGDGMALSRDRAATVKRELVALGVPENRITARGVGNTWPSREPDVAADGSLLPGPAARNRSVIVELTC
jgi:OOP family OmpA-OmpF porin